MALKPPVYTIGGIEYPNERERMLAYGNEFSGKTHCWLSIALLAMQLGGEEQFYAADTDFAITKSMSKTFAGLDNVHLTTTYDFQDLVRWARGLRDIVKPGDWVITDTASSAYGKVQSLFFEKKYGMTRQELEWERLFDPNRGSGPLIQPDEWIAIRDAFLRWWEIDIVGELSFRRGCHLFATAEAKQIFDHFENPSGRDSHKKDKSDWLDYGDLGWRPDGHKSLPHKVNTVFFMKRAASSFWMTPTKDRERDMKPLKLANGFAVDYLLGRAGWTVE